MTSLTALVLLAGACSEETDTETSGDTDTTTPGEAELTRPATLEPTAEVPPAGPATNFGEGTKKVGQDIAPGTYRGNLDSDFCYWERLKGFSGELDDIIANNNATSHEVVTIKETDVGFNSSDCGEWTQGLSQVTASQTDPFSDGMYAVGLDIAPGTWSAAGGAGCYWERLMGFSHELTDIITNDAGSTSPIVTIETGDVAFNTNGCGEWTKQG
jgi:hypothetical protein